MEAYIKTDHRPIWQKNFSNKPKATYSVLVALTSPPLPPISGGAQYAANQLLPLADDYALHALIIGDEPMLLQLQENAELYSLYFHSVTLVARDPVPDSAVGKLWYYGERLFHGLPFLDISYYSPSVVQATRKIIQSYSIDILEMHSTHTAYLKYFFPEIPALLVSHNIESELFPFWERQRLPFPKRQIESFIARCSRKNAKRVEIDNIWNIEAITFISENDMAKVSGATSKYYLPLTFPSISSPVISSSEEPCRVLWLGSFWWGPNLEGMEWFADQIFPLIREQLRERNIQIHVVGSNATEKIKDMSDDKTVFVHGFVEDLQAMFNDSHLLMVPLLSGGGVRVKIIEAMSNGLPVLSTPKGCEGLPVEHGKSIWIADGTEAFAKAFIDLCSDCHTRNRLAEGAVEYIKRNHNKERAIALKKQIYENLLQSEITAVSPKEYIKRKLANNPRLYRIAKIIYLHWRKIFNPEIHQPKPEVQPYLSPYEGLTYLKPIEIEVVEKDYVSLNGGFSVIIPVKNEAEGIADFLQALKKQTAIPEEIIFIDHDSTDGTDAIIEAEQGNFACPVKLLRSRDYYEKLGVAQTTLAQDRNNAVRACCSEIIVMADAGCTFVPEYFAALAGPLLENSDVDMSGAIYHLAKTSKESQSVPVWSCIDWNTFLPSCRGLAVRKSIFEKSRGLPEFLTFAGEDTLFDITYRRYSNKWVFNKKAVAFWHSHTTDHQAWRKYYNWGLGDGESGVGDFYFSFAAQEPLAYIQSAHPQRRAFCLGYHEGKTKRSILDRERRGITETVLLVLERPLHSAPSSVALIKSLVDSGKRVVAISCVQTQATVGSPLVFLDLDISLLELHYEQHFDIGQFWACYGGIDAPFRITFIEDEDNKGQNSIQLLKILKDSLPDLRNEHA